MGKKAPLSFLGLRDKTPRTEQEFFEGIRLPSKLVNSFRGFVRKALDSFFQWLDANSRKKSDAANKLGIGTSQENRCFDSPGECSADCFQRKVEVSV